MMISTLMSGYCRRNFVSFGHRIASAAFGGGDADGAGGLLAKLA
jgi:hypothetical protein